MNPFCSPLLLPFDNTPSSDDATTAGVYTIFVPSAFHRKVPLSFPKEEMPPAPMAESSSPIPPPPPGGSTTPPADFLPPPPPPPPRAGVAGERLSPSTVKP